MLAQSLLAVGGLKTPSPHYVPVFAYDPAFALLRMTTFRPGIEHREEHCAELVKDIMAGNVSVIVCPTCDLRIQCLDYLGLFLRAMSLNCLTQFLCMPFDPFAAGFDPGDTSNRLAMTISVSPVFPGWILSDLESQEFKSRFFSFRCFQRMGDSRFAFLEFQAHPA